MCIEFRNLIILYSISNTATVTECPLQYSLDNDLNLLIFSFKDYIQYGHGHKVSPAIWFRYDLSPITVKYHQRGKHFYSFLTTASIICYLLNPSEFS